MGKALKALQRDFQAYVIAGDPAMGRRIVSNAKADAQTRLDIYSDAYTLRLLEVLESDYEGLHGLLGDEEFDELGRGYIAAYPSRRRSARWFGMHMETFLRDTPRYAGHPVLAEMAAFEWRKGLAFDAAEAALVTIEDVAAIPPEHWGDMYPRLQPCVQRLDLQWNVPTLWVALNNEETPPEPESAEHPQGWLLWRADYDVHWRSLAVDEACALDACAGGESFGALCELLCEWHAPEQAPVQAAGYLKRWVADGLLTALD